MNRFLLLALTAGLLSPIAVKAESYWLILFSGMGKASEKVQMASMEQCQKEGKLFVDESPNYIGTPRFYCVTGK
jgi:hypothetical protein